MPSSWTFIAEATLVYGVAFGWAAHQLWSLRRDRRRKEQEAEQAGRQANRDERKPD